MREDSILTIVHKKNIAEICDAGIDTLFSFFMLCFFYRFDTRMIPITKALYMITNISLFSWRSQ